MKELNDKDFDQAFKQRITETFPEFEEEAWLKMEKKLHRRDTLAFYRNASIILLFLSFGLGFYFIHSAYQEKNQIQVVRKDNKPLRSQESTTATTNIQPTNPIVAHKPARSTHVPVSPVQHQLQTIARINVDSNQNVDGSTADIIAQQTAVPQNSVEKPLNPSTDGLSPIGPTPTNVDQNPTKLVKTKYKIPISLSISAGPDFNSTAALLGGKTSVAVGLSVNVGLSKKLGLQTGLVYGTKNYSATGYDYTFNNPNTQASIAAIQAMCKVLEIPLKATYNLSENKHRSIAINAGLSSYIMLKENYVFEYVPSTGKKDRITEFTNANQHFLSVLDLSATYHIKLNSKKLALGFEPYIKIPLRGIGEGSVPLKSSGISLKLRYELNKK